MEGDMDSSAIEVRAISRAAAALLALIVGVLVATVRVSPAPSPGVGQVASVTVVRKKVEDDAAMAAAEALDAAAPAPFSSLRDGQGFGEEVVLWVTGPGGEIVFRNAERYQRCLAARSRRMEAPDCPSAADNRRMVLDQRAARDA
jgi:hypothetical protein